MRYSVSRMPYLAGLVLALACLIITVAPKPQSAAFSSLSPAAPFVPTCNASPITINPSGAASPYPSTLAVSGMIGVVSNMTVTLNNLSHTNPDDIDMLLVGPGGQTARILSDVGGGIVATNVTLTLDDAAATSLPDSGPLVSGTFKPTNIGAADTQPAPAPPASGASALSVFNGTDPNGIWSLFVSDDTGGDGGSISGGWCLDITTIVIAPCVLTCPANVSQPTDPGQCGAVVTYAAPTSTGVCGPVICSPPSGSFFPTGTTPVNCSATGGGSCGFTVTITGTCPSGCNPSAITINPSGSASPYPSSLTISGNTGVIGSMTVTLNNLSHSFPDDVDILLVGPGGQNAIILSDVGGTIAASNITLTLDDAASNSLPDLGPLVSGTFKPTNSSGVEPFPAPAPAPLGGSALSVFNGTDPNGTWLLYVADDTGGDGGSISGGWCLSFTTVPITPCTLTCPPDVTQANTPGQCGAVVTYAAPATSGTCASVICAPASGSFFPIGTTSVNCTASNGGNCSFNVTVTGTCPSGCNPSSITINQSGGASPYPSLLSISGVSGTVASLTVTLNNLSHTNPDDIDIMLVGPGGQTAVLMSDAGGTIAASNITLTLDDAAFTALPDSGPLVSGTFQPTNFGLGDVLPAPAPPTGGSALSVFNGTDPNGVWRLYVSDDTGGDSGSISGGWCLNITATPPPCTITCPSNQTVSNDPNQCGAVVNYPAPTTTGSCGTVNCAPAAGSFFPVGTTTVNCTTTTGPSCSFTVTVKDTEAPVISPCPANISVNSAGGCQTVTYSTPTATDNCPGATVVCSPPSGFCFPPGATTVTCTAFDASPDSADATCSFTVTVVVCTITCPANISVNNTPGQCGAVVNFAPTTSSGCGTVTCVPASGSFFPVGTTNVACSTTTGPGCSFNVTVVDNQPPTIVCPANVTATAATGQTSKIVSYPAPTVSDNCPGATFVCAPPSGSSFPLGTTTVTCTATDAHANQASCTFKVSVGGALLVNADSFLRDGADNTNEGGNNLLRIQSSGHNRVIVRFNLAGIPTAGLQSATLVLNITDNSDNWGATGRLVDANRLLADWTEGNGHTVGDQPNFRGTGEGVTWNCAKDSNIANQNDDCLSQWNGGTFAAATAAPVLHTNGQLGDVSWNVTADVLAGASNGWIIKKQNEGLAGQVKYFSKEGAAVAGNPNLGPRLVLVYAP